MSSISGVRTRWAGSLIAVVVALTGVSTAAGAPDPHRCPSHRYWTNIVVYRITCVQAVQLRREKLRDCTHVLRR
jgi:hypothetical protein